MGSFKSSAHGSNERTHRSRWWRGRRADGTRKEAAGGYPGGKRVRQNHRGTAGPPNRTPNGSR